MHKILLVLLLMVTSPVLAQDLDGGEPTVAPATTEVATPAEPVPVAEATPAPDEPVAEAPAEATAAPAAEVKAVEEAPSTPAEVAETAGTVVDAVKAGKFAAMAGAVIFFLLSLLRLPALGSVTAKIPPRIRVPAVILLAGLASVFNTVALGTPWVEAMVAGMFTAPTAVFANELFVESLFGKRYKK